MTLPLCVCLDGETVTTYPHGEGEPTWDSLTPLVNLRVHPRTRPDETAERIRDAELVLTNKVVLDETLFAVSPSLKYVGVLATGTNVVDLEAAARRGIIVTRVPAYAAESVVAHVFNYILELQLGLKQYVQSTRAGDWTRSVDFTYRLRPTWELAGRTICIVGMGAIGRRVAEVAHAFRMQVLAVGREGGSRPQLGFPLEWVSVDDGFARADIVSLHCPLTPATEGLVDGARIAAMKPGALLINTGRGGLLDEQAVAAALASGTLGGAAVDVLRQEPPRDGSPLLTAPRCLVTPHVAWATVEARARLMETVTANVAAYLAGTPQNRVA